MTSNLGHNFLLFKDRFVSITGLKCIKSFSIWKKLFIFQTRRVQWNTLTVMSQWIVTGTAARPMSEKTNVWIDAWPSFSFVLLAFASLVRSVATGWPLRTTATSKLYSNTNYNCFTLQATAIFADYSFFRRNNLRSCLQISREFYRFLHQISAVL